MVRYPRTGTSPGNPVVKVDLLRTRVREEDLVLLGAFPELRVLDLSMSWATDDHLKSLRGLNNLTSLNLGFRPITDTGLQHLRGLTKLTSLNLDDSEVTDAGLQHLKGLKLEWLHLRRTHVTDAGWGRRCMAPRACKVWICHTLE